MEKAQKVPPGTFFCDTKSTEKKEFMINAILGTKLGQTQKFTQAGVRIPVSQIQAGPCLVVQAKTQTKDGYAALQLGLGERKEKSVKKPVLGHLKKAGVKKTPRFLAEIRLVEPEEVLGVGEEVKMADLFAAGDLIDVTGISKGKGFAGVVKRWGFAGGPKTHGQSDRERAPGSIGATTTPGRVLKGKKMAGRMGGEKVTVKNLVVVGTDPENNLLFVKGLVPGNKKGLLVIKKIGKAKKFDGLLEDIKVEKVEEVEKVEDEKEKND